MNKIKSWQGRFLFLAERLLIPIVDDFLDLCCTYNTMLGDQSYKLL